jgi:hypothetical protein
LRFLVSHDSFAGKIGLYFHTGAIAITRLPADGLLQWMVVLDFGGVSYVAYRTEGAPGIGKYLFATRFTGLARSEGAMGPIQRSLILEYSRRAIH